ncbi:MAG: hypothetical protein AAGJ18_07640, partial [Bacteroidota bacterium]
FFNFCVLVVFTLLIVACGDDGDSSDLSGSYKITSITIENCSDPSENISFEFDENGCFTEQMVEICVDGDWVFTNDTYTLSFNLSVDGTALTAPQNTSGTFELDGNMITLCDSGINCESANIRFDGDTITVFGITDDDGCEQTLVATKR